MPKLTVKAWRRAKGYTQAEIAELCEVHPNTYSRWEEDPGKIPLEKAKLIAEKLGVSVNDIIFAEEVDKM